MDEHDLNASTDKHSASTQTMIAIVVIGMLLFGCVLVLIPFTSAILWAIILSFSSWSIFSGIKRVLGGRSSLAAVTITLLLASIVVAPFVIVGTSLAGNVADVIEAIRHSLVSGPLSPLRLGSSYAVARRDCCVKQQPFTTNCSHTKFLTDPATIDFRRRFSSSSCRNRRISEISSPPYLLRQM
jgi:hypothetical protein